jgi:hypothetical protein
MTTAFSRALPRVLISATLALLGTVASFSATTTSVQAAPARGAYTVALASPLPQARREIIDGAIWRCEGDRCAAPADGARAVAVCSKVARRFGAVSRFKAPEGELTADQLARCNDS